MLHPRSPPAPLAAAPLPAAAPAVAVPPPPACCCCWVPRLSCSPPAAGPEASQDCLLGGQASNRAAAQRHTRPAPLTGVVAGQVLEHPGIRPGQQAAPVVELLTPLLGDQRLEAPRGCHSAADKGAQGQPDEQPQAQPQAPVPRRVVDFHARHFELSTLAITLGDQRC